MDKSSKGPSEVLIGILVFCLIGVFVLILLKMLPSQIVTKPLTDKEKVILQESCTLKQKYESGRRIYCGKACFRAEIVEEYSCKGGSLIFYN